MMVPGSIPSTLVGNSIQTLIINIGVNTANFSLLSALSSTYGYTNTYPVNVIVNIAAGIVIGATSSGVVAFDTGNIHSGSTITLDMGTGCYILGHGGDGGASGYEWANPGANGGHALYIYPGLTVTLLNGSGAIIGGGGGGGGGEGNRDVAAGGSGGAGGFPGTYAVGGVGSGAAHANATGYSGNLTVGGGNAHAIFSWEDGYGGAGGGLGGWGGIGGCNVDTTTLAPGGAPGYAILKNGSTLINSSGVTIYGAVA